KAVLTSAVVRETRAASGASTSSVNCLESTRVGPKFFSLAVASTVNVDNPARVGVPEIVPLGARLTPAGSAPCVTSHVTSQSGPAPASVAEYGEPSTAALSDVVVIAQRRGQTSNTNSDCALLFAQSISSIQALKVPASVGTPSTTDVWSLTCRSLRPG